jgi:hypothetical protein
LETIRYLPTLSTNMSTQVIKLLLPMTETRIRALSFYYFLVMDDSSFISEY